MRAIELSNITPLVTLDQAKAHIDITHSNDDQFITDVINGMTAEVEKYCQRVLREATVTETFYDPSADVSSSIVTLQEYPVQSITSITTTLDSSDSLMDTGDYRVVKPTAKVILDSTSSWIGADTVTAVYVCGWSEVPADLYSVMLQLIQMRYSQGNNITGNRGPVKFERVDGVSSVSYDTSGMVLTSSGGAKVDPILGQFSTNLDYYRSDRALV